jgi:PAS domain S-box-containing protein
MISASPGNDEDRPLLRAVFSRCLRSLFVALMLSSAPLSAWAEESPKIELTPEEQAWLAQHPDIILATATGFEPLVIKTTEGAYVGVLVDLFEQINQILNTRIRLDVADSWAGAQEKAQNGEVDGLAFGAIVPRRNVLYNPSNIIFTSYPLIFARSQNEYRINSFSDLNGMRIGYKRGAGGTLSQLETLPAATLKIYDSHESMTQALLSRDIDVIAAWMSYDHWRKEKLQGVIDNILLVDEYPLDNVIYIRKDWPELIPILNKALVVLHQNELPRIMNKWFGQWPLASKREEQPRIDLTDEERAWLDQGHTVRARVSDWPPLMFKEPELSGIAVDYLRTISERFGINVKFVPDETGIQEGLQDLMGENTHYDLFLSLKRTPEREEEIAFTDDYISMPWVIYSRDDSSFISGMEDLSGKTVSVEQGFFMEDILEKEYPSILLLKVPTSLDALRAVATTEADAYIGNLSNATWLLREHNLDNLKIVAPTPFGNIDNAMGVRSDWPELAAILSKGLASMSPTEHNAIKNRWQITYKTEPDYTLLLQVLAGAFFLLFVIVLWNRALKKSVIERTAKLSKSEVKFRNLIDNSLVGIFSTTIDGKFIFVNEVLVKMFDFDSPEEMVANGSVPCWKNSEERDQLISDLQEHGSESNVESENITNNDRHIYILFSVKLHDEVITGMVMDITERREAEQRILEYQQNLKTMTSRLIVAEEQERRRIATDLHDNVGTTLALSRLQLATASKSIDDAALKEQLDELSQTLLTALKDTRNLIFDLGSSTVTELGLGAAISEWVEQKIDPYHYLTVELVDELERDSLDRDQSTVLLRNVRELLANVAKHSQADRVSILLKREGGDIQITVKDNGIGFLDPEKLKLGVGSKGGFGLFSIEERMTDLSGAMEIKSEVNHGTTVVLTVPSLASTHETAT